MGGLAAGLVSWGGSGEDRVDLSASLPDAGIFVSYIDVGQGDSAFVSCGDDTLLIDAGVSSRRRDGVDYLRSLGVTELDYVVCTHAHEDHCGGLDDVIEAFEVGTLFAPYTEFDTSGAFTRFEDTAADKGLYVTVPELGAEFTLGGAVFEFVGPRLRLGRRPERLQPRAAPRVRRDGLPLHGRHLRRAARRLRAHRRL